MSIETLRHNCRYDMYLSLKTGDISNIPDKYRAETSKLMRATADIWYQSEINNTNYNPEEKAKIHDALLENAESIASGSKTPLSFQPSEELLETLSHICVLYQDKVAEDEYKQKLEDENADFVRYFDENNQPIENYEEDDGFFYDKDELPSN